MPRLVGRLCTALALTAIYGTPATIVIGGLGLLAQASPGHAAAAVALLALSFPYADLKPTERTVR